MKASEIAGQAAALLSGDRARTHGDKKVNHDNIAALWNAYLGRRGDKGPLRGSDVAAMMVLLKVARTLAGSHNPDDWIDAVGYSCIAGELAESEVQPPDPVSPAGG